MLYSRKLFAVALVPLLAVSAVVAETPDRLKKGFEDPPQSARPWVWWHWMNGNISKDGITLDLEWMHRIGLAGFQMFDANLATPQVVEKRLVYMTPEWKDAFRYATTLADQLGLKETIASSPGWSETGGPWVPPSEAMKKYVWSETPIEGGKPFQGKLIHPPTVTGPFQNFRGDSPRGLPEAQFYADSVVVAYPAMTFVGAEEGIPSKITVSAGDSSNQLPTEGVFSSAITLLTAPRAGDKAWIQYTFPHIETLRSLSIACHADPDAELAFEASNDGVDFRKVAAIPGEGNLEQTVSFPPASAKYFRITFKTPPDIDSEGNTQPPAAARIVINDLVLHRGSRVSRFEDKAAFTPVANLSNFPTPEVLAENVIRPEDVIDLTSSLQTDGRLDWTPPAGKWVVLRIGYSLLGVTNHPATKEATGLEVDKLNATFVEHYMDRYLDTFKETVGADLVGKRGIQSMVTDSWEAGAQNWTDDMLAQFAARRGYDPRPWLPVLSGQIVKNAKASDQFLWDLRKTIADLTAEAHYGQVADSLKKWGLEHYGESHEWGRAMIADGMEVKKLDDIPMSAMWTQRIGVNKQLYSYNADDRESASVAHIYGQKIAAAESMTAKYDAWGWSPATLKPTADQELLNGINRFVIHESSHQPLANKPPGLTLGPYGQWFNRYETWAEEAAPWISYLARSSFLLQQGTFVADVLYFYGEDTNLTSLFGNSSPSVPAGYAFDYINADALIHKISVSDGALATQSGMRYRLLVLDGNSKHMSLPVLRAIYQLVKSGGTVVGAKPFDTPSLADDATEWKRLNDELFPSGNGTYQVGRGRVYVGQSVEEALHKLHLRPDFECSQKSGSPIEFVHRKLTKGDIYFLNNRTNQSVSVKGTFRVRGRRPEFWYAETGTTEPASYMLSQGRTSIPLRIAPWGTVFVVFRRPATAKSYALPEMIETELTTLNSNWLLNFQQDRGAPANLMLDELQSWSKNENPAIKYFSGAGTYVKTVNAYPAWFIPDASLWLDLGDVGNLAVVKINGKSLGTVWHTPYRVNVTYAFRLGPNKIEIKAINSWVNRLVGDQQPGTTKKYTFTDITPYTANSPLQKSGVLGPIRLLRESRRR